MAQVRDTPVAARATGTASIAGVVTTDEATPRPLRRVTVMLATGDIRMPEAAVTDDNGAFAFGNLPAGNYTLLASRMGYVQSYYGAKKPGRGPGVPIAVADGEHVTGLTMKILHGGAISGTIRNQNGAPMPGVSVQVTEVQLVNGQRRISLAGIQTGATTDDRGMYRQFGLGPGLYVVMVRSALVGLSPTEARQVTADDVRWAQSATGTNVAPGMAPPPVPAAPEPGQTVAYTPVYYPGTVDPSAASPIVLGPGEDKEGIDFSAMLVPTAKISGTILDPNGQIPQSAQVSLSVLDAQSTDIATLVMSIVGGIGGGNTTTRDGKFTVTGVIPGRYKLMVKGAAAAPPGSAPPAAMNPMAALMGGRAGGMPGGGNLWAQQEVVVNGRDVSNLSLQLQNGMTVSGKVVYETSTQKPPVSSNTRVTLSSVQGGGGDLLASMMSSLFAGAGGPVADDGTFVLKDVLPDKYRASVLGPGMLGAIASLAAAAGQPNQLPPDTWTLKSVVLNGRDVGDSGFDVSPGGEVTGLVLTYTDRPSELSGRVVDRSGRPAPGFPILVFSTDRTTWSLTSRRVRQARPSSDGKYSIVGLPAGEYYVCALTDLEPTDLADPTFFEQLMAASIKITIADGEKKTQDLRLAGGS